MEYYTAARAGQIPDAPKTPKRHVNSLDAAIETFLACLLAKVEAGNADIKTHKQKKSLLEAAASFTLGDFGVQMGVSADTWFGDCDRVLSVEALEHMRDCWGQVTAQTDNCTKALRSMYKDLRIKPNPANAVEYIHVSKGGAIP